MNNNITLGVVALTAFSSTSLQAKTKEPSTKQKPNIVIVYVDDMGYGDIGLTGHPEIKTPNLDRMGHNGMRFTNYYSASPASTASRYALLTGRYPIRSGFGWVLNPDSPRGIHPKEKTLAEQLKEQGYRTAIFGKWHLGSTKKEYLPLQNGFDEYLGLPYSNDMIPPKYPSVALIKGNDTLQMDPDQSTLTALYTQQTISFIERNKKENFFIYVPYAMPHVPLYPGKAFAGRSARGIYGDVVEEIDWGVGEILKALKRAGVDKNTIVWFMSDNGPWIIKNQEGGSSGLFRDGKGSTWEGGVRVPCLVHWPGRLNGVVCDQVVTAMDVYATSVWMAGGNIPNDRVVDGQNIAACFGYDVPPKPQTPHFYYGINNQLMAVRKGEWKLHLKTYSQLGAAGDYYKGRTPLLFNVRVDPSEKYEVADKHPEIVKELTQLYWQKLDEVKKTGNFFD